MERYIQQLLEQFPDDLNYAIKHFPLARHQVADEGALAALAAGKQGKFWEFHSQLLENHDNLDEAKILEIAGQMGLDMEKFSQDRVSADSYRIVREDIANGRAVGVKGTPTVFLNGKRIKNPGALPELIRQELEKKERQ